ncbi:hypothetical protein GQR58_013447 [Nymphon striatum]|nr:hypothetical protein GQR58_013447 [Nymphon striatum]
MVLPMVNETWMVNEEVGGPLTVIDFEKIKLSDTLTKSMKFVNSEISCPYAKLKEHEVVWSIADCQTPFRSVCTKYHAYQCLGLIVDGICMQLSDASTHDDRENACKDIDFQYIPVGDIDIAKMSSITDVLKINYHCENGISYNGVCYFVNIRHINAYSSAEANCKSQGGSLARPTTEKLQKRLFNICQMFATLECIIGVKASLSGEIKFEDDIKFTPTVISGINTLIYVCTLRTVLGSCEGQVHGSECIYPKFTEILAYDEAKKGCEDDGGRVAVPTSASLYFAMYDFYDGECWTGVVRDENKVYFLDDGYKTTLNVSFWYPGEPNFITDTGTIEDCVIISITANKKTSWYDASCDNKYKGITCSRSVEANVWIQFPDYAPLNTDIVKRFIPRQNTCAYRYEDWSQMMWTVSGCDEPDVYPTCRTKANPDICRRHDIQQCGKCYALTQTEATASYCKSRGSSLLKMNDNEEFQQELMNKSQNQVPQCQTGACFTINRQGQPFYWALNHSACEMFQINTMDDFRKWLPNPYPYEYIGHWLWIGINFNVFDDPSASEMLNLFRIKEFVPLMYQENGKVLSKFAKGDDHHLSFCQSDKALQLFTSNRGIGAIISIDYLQDAKYIRECEKDWLSSGGFCYRIFRGLVDKEQGEKNCRLINGNLATIENEMDESLLIKKMTFEYIGRALVKSTNSPCSMLVNEDIYKLNTECPKQFFHYICEKPGLTCPDEYTYNYGVGKCMRIVSYQLDFQNAEDLCRKDQAIIWPIMTDLDLDLLKNISIKFDLRKVWTGIKIWKKYNVFYGKFSNNQEITNFSRFSNIQLEENSNKLDVMLNYEPGSVMLKYAYDPYEHARFICEYIGNCPPGYKLVDFNCYKVSEPSTSLEAQTNCAMEGGKIVSHTYFMGTDFHDTFKNMVLNGDQSQYWSGVFRNNYDGYLYRNDGIRDIDESVDFTNPYCMVISSFNLNHQPAHCFTSFHKYVCRIEGFDRCPFGYFPYVRSCYMPVEVENSTIEACANAGGVKSENEFLNLKIRNITNGIYCVRPNATCPIDWEIQSNFKSSNNATKCVKIFSTPVSYSEAETTCQSQGTILYIPRSTSTSESLFKIAENNFGVSNNLIWTGVYSDPDTITFHTSDNDPVLVELKYLQPELRKTTVCVLKRYGVWRKLSDSDLEPLRWGWQMKDDMFAQVMTDMAAGPEDVLKSIFVAVAKDCVTDDVPVLKLV